MACSCTACFLLWYKKRIICDGYRGSCRRLNVTKSAESLLKTNRANGVLLVVQNTPQLYHDWSVDYHWSIVLEEIMGKFRLKQSCTIMHGLTSQELQWKNLSWRLFFIKDTRQTSLLQISIFLENFFIGERSKNHDDFEVALWDFIDFLCQTSTVAK